MNATTTPRTWTLSPGGALALPGAFILALTLAGLGMARPQPVMFASFLGAAAVAAAWLLVLFAKAQSARRTLTLSWTPKPQHWVQAIAQAMVYYWWGRYVPIVGAFVPFIVAQLVFAYAIDALLNWSRRDHYNLGFGPFPIILSINLFLWFRPDWFYWQFVMIAVGFLAKELIRWQRDGRSAHIFNPSSFPLAMVSIYLIATQGSDTTFGNLIANTQFDPPHMYLLLFLAAVPGQFLFGVARMTLSAVLTMMVISLVYFQATGTYLFLDAHIPVPVFLGMLLLVTDPSTSPRTELGRIMFGMLYAVLTTVLFLVLPLVGAPTFYDKLLPVPFMNLMVRGIDRLAVSQALAALDPARLMGSLAPMGRNLAFGTVMALVFTGLYGTGALGDHHPGQYLPFWKQACEVGNERACRYESFLTLTYCNNGSGWACNEAGIQFSEARRDPGPVFLKGCELGFSTACTNVARGGAGEPLVREPPLDQDLPIVLRGTKPVLTERDPTALRAIGCAQGWTELCGPTGS
ncbi:MAG TPA: hypothetical protein VLA36_09565 [Longimicrobiales bacterium]|nr:hypothetical protein [Longimicrobiales bacterium]